MIWRQSTSCTKAIVIYLFCTWGFCSATKTRFYLSWFSVKSFCTSKQGKVEETECTPCVLPNRWTYQTLRDHVKQLCTPAHDLGVDTKRTGAFRKILQNAFERRYLRVNIYSTSNGGKRNLNTVMETFHWHPPKTYFPKEKKFVWGRVWLVTAVRCGSSRRSIVS